MEARTVAIRKLRIYAIAFRFVELCESKEHHFHSESVKLFALPKIEIPTFTDIPQHHEKAESKFFSKSRNNYKKY